MFDPEKCLFYNNHPVKKKPVYVNIMLCLAPVQESVRKRADACKSVNGQKRMYGSEGLR